METDLFRRHLPHWHPPNAVYFVTFRLAGSLPQEALEKLKQEREAAEQKLARQFQGEALAEEKYKLFKKMFARYDDLLAQSPFPCWLAEEQIARIVQDEIKALDPQNYRLICYCIMPNHVHLLIDLQAIAQPAPLKEGQHYTALSHAMKLLKGRTGYACRKVIGGSGAFWQHESYDHVVRNQREFENIIGYILNNPVKAGLVNEWQEWRYSFLREW
ncbi:MAG: transposase [Anaerolineales bacterium]